MVTTKQKPTADTQKIKNKELKNTTRENHLIKKGKQQDRKEQVHK
jgi:hypothetical protein